MNWKQKLSKIPKSPGVYIFHDKNGKIIYIGKAKVLQNRVRSYFNKLDATDSKTKVMVKNIVDIDWMILDSEVEALLTEANLIKEHKPRYNVFLKDDKTFPYIRITNEPFPRVEIIRQKNLTKDDHNYFGPYTDAGYLREILRVIHKIFPLRTCTYFIDTKFIKEKKISVCLDYHIKRCEGPCEGLVSSKEYNEMITQIKRFLKGHSKDIKKYLQAQMDIASKNQDYEDEFHAKIKIELIVEDSILEQALESIKKAAYSGKIGDGKIFVSNIEQVMRIRTGEKGSEAV